MYVVSFPKPISVFFFKGTIYFFSFTTFPPSDKKKCTFIISMAKDGGNHNLSSLIL